MVTCRKHKSEKCPISPTNPPLALHTASLFSLPPLAKQCLSQHYITVLLSTYFQVLTLPRLPHAHSSAFNFLPSTNPPPNYLKVLRFNSCQVLILPSLPHSSALNIWPSTDPPPHCLTVLPSTSCPVLTHPHTTPQLCLCQSLHCSPWPTLAALDPVSSSHGMHWHWHWHSTDKCSSLQCKCLVFIFSIFIFVKQADTLCLTSTQSTISCHVTGLGCTTMIHYVDKPRGYPGEYCP